MFGQDFIGSDSSDYFVRVTCELANKFEGKVFIGKRKKEKEEKTFFKRRKNVLQKKKKKHSSEKEEKAFAIIGKGSSFNGKLDKLRQISLFSIENKPKVKDVDRQAIQILGENTLEFEDIDRQAVQIPIERMPEFRVSFFQMIPIRSETRFLVNIENSCIQDPEFVRKRIKGGNSSM